jgi:predicted  nucleic acid-binding Zn-ribbon protein
MIVHARWLSFLLVAIPMATAVAQRHADLNPVEVNQLRDTAMEPEKRLKLYIDFARQRLAKLDQIRSNPKMGITERGSATHDGLQDFLDVYDELNDNVDTYADRKNDIRKPLKVVMDADNEFQAKLRALQDSAASSKEDTKPYDFVLSNALDTIKESINDHRQLMQEQAEAAKHKKKKQ